MAKQKAIFICQECGAESPKWIGRCPSCNNWNTYVEEIKITGKSGAIDQILDSAVQKPSKLNEIESINQTRLSTGISELDRILGGGLVSGSLILLGGDPGIGKSTLALQLALNLDRKVLYVSGEESLTQIKLRADRIDSDNENCLIFNEVRVEQIVTQVAQVKPELIVVDSIQTMTSVPIESSPGSVSQVRECAARFLQLAKETSIPVIIIGHITKDGSLAGPKILEHIVDTVLQFEGDQHLTYRLLRSLKNRFGAVPEMGIFEMTHKGLVEILNPSEVFLNRHSDDLSGVAVAATIDGMRPFMIEVQGLVGNAVYGNPQRINTGMDARRLNMLLAVLEKRGGLNLSNKDVFLNIAGGLKVQDTAVDLAILAAIVSSHVDRNIPAHICFCSEISLTGELRQVSRIEQRIAEAEKLGFRKIVIPSIYKKSLKLRGNIQPIYASVLGDALKHIFHS